MMGAYFDSKHEHKGVGVDKSKQIDYNDLLNQPDLFSPLYYTGNLSSPVSIPNSTDTVIPYNGTGISSGTFTAQEDGLYLFTYQVDASGTYVSARGRLYLFKNAALNKIQQFPIFTSTIFRTPSMSIYLSSGDTVQIKINQTTGNTWTLNTTFSELNIIKIAD